jgi:GNAT superfamily N-acetyltransferase
MALLPGMYVAEELSAGVMAALQSADRSMIEGRFAAGHRAYVARMGDEYAAWGWVATREAKIGELGLSFSVPEGERYLWNFVTRPAFRGRGIYPRLLQEIVRQESRTADRFWIVYAPENHASERADGQVVVRAGTEMPFFGATAASGDLTPCWKCARAGRVWLMRCAPGACRCDYQRPLVTCHEGTMLAAVPER